MRPVLSRELVWLASISLIFFFSLLNSIEDHLSIHSLILELRTKLLAQEFPDLTYKDILHAIKTHVYLNKAHAALVSDSQFGQMNKLRRRRKSLKIATDLATDSQPPVPSPDITWPGYQVAARELWALRKKNEKADAAQREERARAAEEEANLAHAKETNTISDCGCCFSEFPHNRMLLCDDPQAAHWICYTCVRTYVESQIGSSKHNLICIHFDGCKATWARSQLALAVPSRSLEKLDQLRQQREIQEAFDDEEFENLVECPFCEFKALVETPIDVDKEFRCQNDDCRIVSCRKCRLETHIPRTCEEAAKDKGIDVRHAVEEAMTEALVRSCNKCKNKFVKEFGCNKMTCPSCGNLQCYVCSKTVSDYRHFADNYDRHNGRNGSKKCPLHDDTEKRHEDEVKQAEQDALKKVREEHPELAEEELKIQVSEAVQEADTRRRNKATHRVIPPPVPHVFPPPVPPVLDNALPRHVVPVPPDRPPAPPPFPPPLRQTFAAIAQRMRATLERQAGRSDFVQQGFATPKELLLAAEPWIEAGSGLGDGEQTAVRMANPASVLPAALEGRSNQHHENLGQHKNGATAQGLGNGIYHPGNNGLATYGNAVRQANPQQLAQHLLNRQAQNGQYKFGQPFPPTKVDLARAAARRGYGQMRVQATQLTGNGQRPQGPFCQPNSTGALYSAGPNKAPQPLRDPFLQTRPPNMTAVPSNRMEAGAKKTDVQMFDLDLVNFANAVNWPLQPDDDNKFPHPGIGGAESASSALQSAILPAWQRLPGKAAFDGRCRTFRAPPFQPTQYRSGGLQQNVLQQGVANEFESLAFPPSQSSREPKGKAKAEEVDNNGLDFYNHFAAPSAPRAQPLPFQSLPPTDSQPGHGNMPAGLDAGDIDVNQFPLFQGDGFMNMFDQFAGDDPSISFHNDPFTGM